VSSPSPSLILLGGGGHAAVVAEAARAAGWQIEGYLDDAPQRGGGLTSIGLKRLGAVDELHEIAARLGRSLSVHAAVGDPALRRRWFLAADPLPLATIAHPLAVVSPSASIAAGVFIGPLAVINARAAVGRGTIINSAAVIEHDCDIGDFVHIAPGAALCGGASVGDEALIGVHAAVLPRVQIGAGAILGAGAVAVRDIPAGVTATGVPARAAAASLTAASASRD
jgi:acetyltransferase EpsM